MSASRQVYEAAPRDASWYANPNTSSFKVVHIDNGEGLAACNSHMLLGVPRWADAQQVPTLARCRRFACQARFTENERVS